MGVYYLVCVGEARRVANGVCTLRFLMDCGLRVTGVSSGQASDGQQCLHVTLCSFTGFRRSNVVMCRGPYSSERVCGSLAARVRRRQGCICRRRVETQALQLSRPAAGEIFKCDVSGAEVL
ncbi:hypothetical protein E2C01_078041 [Portunus trituberculatus]|uniref:Uncharacterized protein n=1 Tax=Portunus trituberculatus TaxID=210409 RepID=A0A5B7ILL9_PORTR|nr:hypothetical protein [Portunus trituberculatus]